MRINELVDTAKIAEFKSYTSKKVSRLEQELGPLFYSNEDAARIDKEKAILNALKELEKSVENLGKLLEGD